MKRGLPLLTLMLIMASGLSSASAVEHSPELWHVTHVTDPTSGKFNYCAIESSFDNGLYLAFARNREFNTNIVVSFPDKRLQDHAKYQMTVAIDQNPPREMMGFAADPTILVVPLQHDRVILGWLQKGKLLDLKGPQDSVKFALDGASDAFRKLQQCVEKSLKDETVQGTTPSHVTPESADVAHVAASDTVEPLPLPAGSSDEHTTAAAPVPTAPASAKSEAASAPTVPTEEASAAEPSPPAPVKPVETTVAKAPAPLQPSVEVASAQAAPAPLAPAPAPVAEKPPAPLPPPPTVAAAESPMTPPQQPAAEQSGITIGTPGQTIAGSAPVRAQTAAPAAVPPPVAEQAPLEPVKLSIPELMAAAALKPAGKCTEKSSSCTWAGDKVLGSVTETKMKDSFLDSIMDDSDRREKQCKGQFSASNGAPMRRAGLMVAEASYTCTRDNGPVTDVTLYLDTADKVIAVATSTPGPDAGRAIQVRDRIEASLPAATNSK